MKQYFYAEGQQQMGPVSFEELKNVGLTTDTLVWFDGLADWNKAGDLSELDEIFNPTAIQGAAEVIDITPTTIPSTEIVEEIVSENKATTKEEEVPLAAALVAKKQTPVVIPVLEYALEAASIATCIEPMITPIMEQLAAAQTPIVEHIEAKAVTSRVEQAAVIAPVEVAPEVVAEALTATVASEEVADIASAAPKKVAAVVAEVSQTANEVTTPAAAEMLATQANSAISTTKEMVENTSDAAENTVTNTVEKVVDSSEEAVKDTTPKKGIMASLKRLFGK